MKAILGDEINELIQNNDLQAIENIQVNDESIIDIEKLPLLKTPKGVFTDSKKQLSVSQCGERFWGVHVTKYPNFRLLMQCFRTRKSLLFNYEHQGLISAVMVAEDLGLAMTVGHDDKTVLHCLDSGSTIKVFGIDVSCLFRLGSVVAVADFEKEVRFFDLIKQKMLDLPLVEIDFDVLCMQICTRKSPKNNKDCQSSLFLGGINSTQIIEIILPKAITQKSIILINS
jgi:hypothetical protein